MEAGNNIITEHMSQLFRLVCFINSTLHYRQEGIVADLPHELVCTAYVDVGFCWMLYYYEVYYWEGTCVSKDLILISLTCTV